MDMKDHLDFIYYDKYYSFYYDFGVDKLHQIIQCCPNLRRLKIVLSGKNFWKTLEETFASDESQLKSQIKILELDFDDEAFLMVQDRKVAIDIKKIINHTTTNLNELVVRNTDRHEREDLVFVPGKFCSGKNCFLTKISILCHCYKMTKACLDYITSEELTALKHLDLYIELIESFDESGEVVGVQESSSGEEAYPWNTLKQFCLSKLEYYSIIFTDENETNIFNFDNCNVNDWRLLKVFLLMYGPLIDDDDDW
ncbi:unnamed protein product [Mucor hiemalis]